MEKKIPHWIKLMMSELKEIELNKFKIIGRYAGDFAEDFVHWCQKAGDYGSKVFYEKGNRIILLNEEICQLLKSSGLKRMKN